MASKLALTAVLFLALVALTSATRSITTVTTTEIDEANPSQQQQQQCQRQLQGRQFRSCQMYLSQRSSQYEEDEEIEMISENRTGREQYKEQCCEQLRNVNEQCRCEAIRQAVRQQQQQEGSSYQGEKMQRLYQKARDLPRECSFRQQCQIRAIFV